MAIRWCFVFVLALVLVQAKGRDVPNKEEAITEAIVAHNGNKNTVEVGTIDKNKNTVPNGKGVKDKKCGMLVSGIGGWGAVGGFIPLRDNAVKNGHAEAVNGKILP